MALESMTALVRSVSPRLADGELTFLDREPVDVALAERQHRDYVAVLTSLGCRTVELPPLPDHPDGVFVEDVVVVVDDLAVLTRPGADSRRAEVDSVQPVLEELGLTVARIEAPGTLDGGDVLQVGDEVLIGRSSRSNAAGVDQLRRLMESRGRRVTICDVVGCLHLKTGVTALPDGALLAVPGWVGLDEVNRPVLAAPEPPGADVVLLGSTVVMSASAPRTAQLVTERGFDVRPVDISEFEAVEGGPTCLSVLVPTSGHAAQ